MTFKENLTKNRFVVYFPMLELINTVKNATQSTFWLSVQHAENDTVGDNNL